MKELIPNRYVLVKKCVAATDEVTKYHCDRFCDCGAPQSPAEVTTPFPAVIYKVAIYDAQIKYKGTKREYQTPQRMYITVKPLNSKHKYSFCIDRDVNIEMLDKEMSEVLYGKS